MIFENEKQLLKIIKYVPSIFLISISLIILSFLYFENIKIFNNQKKELHTNYILNSKDLIRERVESTYNHILQIQSTTESELKKSLKEEMSKVYSIAQSIYENNKDIRTSDEIKKLIKDAIRPIRYNNGRGYFFIHDKSTFSNTMHPIMPKLEGKNSYNVKDARGAYIIRQMHEELKKSDETHFEWYWYRPGNKEKQYKKIGYIKNFKPFNWFIGTGEYVKDFEKQVQQKVLDNIKKIKYDTHGYMFVIGYDGKILNYYKKELINKNAFDILKSSIYIKNMIGLGRDNSFGFFNYDIIPNPKNNNPSKKTSYIRGIDNWGWVIGTGFYADDVNVIIDKKKEEMDRNVLLYMKNTIIITIVLTVIIFFFSIYFARIVRRKFEKYKEEINSHLEYKVQQESILSQQSKMASMGEMIGNIAHQWRQPLSSISSSVTSMILQKELNILDEQTLVKNLNHINKKSQYLSSTIDGFRNFFNSNKNKELFSVKDVIDEIFSLVDLSLNKEIVFIKNINNVKIESFKNEFMQVIINIVKNASDVLIEKEFDKFIFIDVYEHNKELIIDIKDSGGGIKADNVYKVFEPYFTTKHKSQGTGIGLYMTNEIITKHMNGTISVSNEEFTYKNKTLYGAKFQIKIPI